MAHYANPSMCGLNKVINIGNGETIEMHWYKAYPDNYLNLIAYNIYYSIAQDDVFLEGPKYVVIDGSLCAKIPNLTPGQDYWFSVRPIEYDPTIINYLSTLPLFCENLYSYPHSILREDISATDLIIPLLDTECFPNYGIVKVGVELIQFSSVDYINNNLIVPPAGSNQPAALVLQSNNQYYLPNANNKGSGSLSSLTLISQTPPPENWNILCVFVEQDGYGNPIPNTAKFEAIGSVSGSVVDQYGNFIIWIANGQVVSNNILSFSIIETSTFHLGDSFLVQNTGIIPGASGGRGFNNTPITFHNTNGWDGYNRWSPIVKMTAITEDLIFDNIYACQARFEYPHFPFTIIDGYKQVNKDILSTDLAAADAENIKFPTYDYAGWHRTDPVQLFTGQCVGSYFGGAKGTIDKYGNYNIYRGLYLEDENTQRQDFLLSNTGRPACLIQRAQTGIVCNCYLALSEYPDDRCPVCFIPGTMVRTENGYKPIETILVGEKVLTSDGQFRKVSKTFEREYNGEIHSILSSVNSDAIFATPEHPFKTVRGAHKKKLHCGPQCNFYINKGDGNPWPPDARLSYGKWQARVTIDAKRISLGAYHTKQEAVDIINKYKEDFLPKGHKLDWDDAKNIKQNDWLVAKWPSQIKDIEKIIIPQKFKKNTILGSQRLGPNEFIVDEEFLWIIGMYLAEGCNGKRSISFVLHKKETNFSERIIKFFTKLGYHPSIHLNKKANGMVVEVYSTTLANWFPNWLGKHCNNKHIPEELMLLPNNKARALIQGVYDGDGSKREHCITQTSKILALQLSELLHRVGEQPLLWSYQPKILTPNGNKRKRTYSISWAEDTLVNKNRQGRWIFENEVLSQVKKTEKIEYYSGKVYNLEVEENHTYVVEGVVTHNCLGSKFQLGWNQYFNPRRSDGRILVRTSPTPENLKMHEAGLESEFPLDMWTLTVPTIKTRDIIILFDQDGNEEFRYEVSNVYRNNTIIGLDGGQHLNTFRIRKTDPAYQIRTFEDTADFPTKLQTTLGFAPGAIPPHTHTFVINEYTKRNLHSINQWTDISQGHRHEIINGIVMENGLNHSHKIILP